MVAKKKKAAHRKSPAKGKAVAEKVLAEANLETPQAQILIEGTDLQGSALRGELRAYKQQVNELTGRTIVGFASEAATTYLLRRPSGIVDLDAATGGGLPSGGLIQIAGPQSAGKTWLALQYLKMHQMIRGEAFSSLWVCAEPTGGFDFKIAAKMGLKVGLPINYIPQLQELRAMRAQPLLTDEEIMVLTSKVGELMVVQAYTGEEALEAVLRGVERRLFGIIVIDSLTNLMPMANAGKDLDEENKRAARASLITDFVNHCTPQLNKFGEVNYTTVIGISQARSNAAKAEAGAKGKYMKDWDIPVAWAWKHNVMQNILLWDGQKIKKTYQKQDYIIGKQVHWSVGKGKFGAHEHVFGEYDFHFDDVCPAMGLRHGVDRAETTIVEGIRFGIIREHKGSLVLVRAADGVAFMSGIPNSAILKQMIDTDFGLEMYLHQEIMAARGIECRYL